MSELITPPRERPRLAPSGVRDARIVSVGSALPRTAVPNEAIAGRLGVDERWIFKRIGVKERRVVQPDESLADLAVAAGRDALERAGIAATDVDLVLVGTSTNDDLVPAAAPVVATRLGCGEVAAIDIGAACMGFLSALALGAAYVETGRARVVLLIGADVPSRYLDHDDRDTSVLFGDGAGAAVLAAGDGIGRMGPCVLRSDGTASDVVYMRRSDSKLRMDGRETFKHAVKRVAEVTTAALEAAGLEIDDIDLFVFHQANARIITAVGHALHLPSERVHRSLENVGNTSAASIPLALASAVEQKRMRAGDLVLLAGIGAGLTYGATVVEWGSDDC